MAYLIVDDEVDSQRDDFIDITSRMPTNIWTTDSVHALVTFQLLGLRFTLYLCILLLGIGTLRVSYCTLLSRWVN